MFAVKNDISGEEIYGFTLAQAIAFIISEAPFHPVANFSVYPL